MAEWTPVLTGDGSLTLRNDRLGEACHDLAGAWTESCERYALPTGLGRRAAGADPVRLLDIGTGLGWNLAAALAAVEQPGGTLDAVGIELDPTVIERTIGLDRESGLAAGEAGRWHGKVTGALERVLSNPDAAWKTGIPLGERSRLRLALRGVSDVLEDLEGQPGFDAIFLDFFSRASDPRPWEGRLIQAIAGLLAPGGLLATYSAALDLRVHLAAAGLQVGKGPKVAGKAEGTLAGRGVAGPPLADRTRRKLLRRLERLSASD